MPKKPAAKSKTKSNKTSKEKKPKKPKEKVNQKNVIVEPEGCNHEQVDFDEAAHSEYFDKFSFIIDLIRMQTEHDTIFEALVAMISISSTLAHEIGMPIEQLQAMIGDIYSMALEATEETVPEESSSDAN